MVTIEQMAPKLMYCHMRWVILWFIALKSLLTTVQVSVVNRSEIWCLLMWMGVWLHQCQVSRSRGGTGCNAVLIADYYNDIIMGEMASQITSLTIVYSTVYSGEDQRKHQSSASLAFVRGIHWWPVNSSLKWPVTRKMFSFDNNRQQAINELQVNEFNNTSIRGNLHRVL